MATANRKIIGLVMGLAAYCMCFTSRLAAQESIKLKNVMTAPITVLVQSEQKTAPVNIRIRVNDIHEYKLKDKGPYTIQVVPDDQPNSGYHLGTHDLRQLAKVLQGVPLDLEGDFTTYEDQRTMTQFEVRTGVHFDIPHPVRGFVFRSGGSRVDYEEAMAIDGRKPEPTARTAVIAAVVPSTAKVSIDGHILPSKGELRFFTSPPITPGKLYSYSLKVEWSKDGHECAETFDIDIRAGEVSRVFFRMPVPTPRVILLPVGALPVLPGRP
jgi:uncharacterized protein (TIGR03000 family)